MSLRKKADLILVMKGLILMILLFLRLNNLFLIKTKIINT